MKQFIYAIIFIIIVIAYFILGKELKKEEDNTGLEQEQEKENKEKLADFYRIDRATLAKWVRYFPCGITPEKWKTIRKLTVAESNSIKLIWGNDINMILNKTQLAEKGLASKKVVAKCVKENLEKIGLTEEAWESLSVFPPVICERIIILLIGKDKQIPTLEEKLETEINNHN